MTALQVVTIAYLAMAVINIAWQSVALRRLRAGSTPQSRVTPFYGGLLRTAWCRVIVAVLYIGVGQNALWPRAEVLLFSFSVFCVTLGVWMVNSWLDLRLNRRLSTILESGWGTGDGPSVVTESDYAGGPHVIRTTEE